MLRSHWKWLCLACLPGVVFAQATPGNEPLEPSAEIPKEYKNETARDIALRSRLAIEITNVRGAIRVIGWNQSKVRVIQKKTVQAPTSEAADAWMGRIAVGVHESKRKIEIVVEQGKGLEIEEKLKERKTNPVRMDLVVYAPADHPIELQTGEGAIEIMGWRSRAAIRNVGGPVSVDGWRGDELLIQCKDCPVSLSKVSGNTRCLSGAGALQVSEAVGSQLYFETTTGAIELDRVSGALTLVTQSGAVVGRRLSGMLDFQTHSGGVDIQDSRGAAAGRTLTGDIKLEYRAWRPKDKVIVESDRGSIEMLLPPSLAADLDAWSISGTVFVDFPVRQQGNTKRTAGSQAPGRIQGKVQDGDQHMQIFSRFGNVRLLRGV